MTEAEKKARWRKSKKEAGYKEVRVWVWIDKEEDVKQFAASLPNPPTPTNPNQMSLLPPEGDI